MKSEKLKSDAKHLSAEFAKLRHRAEELLKGVEPSDAQLDRKRDETLRLFHELEVHRIELEMQNAELREARAEVETALVKYTDLYDFAPVGYFTLDRDGTIRAANLTGAGLLGIVRSRLIGRRFGQFVPAGTRSVFSAFLEKVFTSPAKEACEAELLDEGNSLLHVQVEGVAVASGEECRIAVIDVTGRKRAEEALRREKEEAEKLRLAKEAAEAIARAKSQFLANMSHELRTPLTGILGMLQLALEKELAPEPRDYLETTLSSARSLLRVLNDILDMAKIEAENLTIAEKAFSIHRCVTEAVDIFAPEVRRKGLEFSLSIAEDVPDAVLGDQARLRQVLLNLVGNAVKFTKEGKLEVRVIADRTTSDGKRKITFVVTDTGIGIPDDKKELLFRAFSQVDASHSRSYGGTGLGLAISREIVELMGGTISFESKEGVGSTFAFTIPLVETEESAALSLAEPHTPETSSPALEGERIPRLLLAEDDPTSREVFGVMLKRSNYQLDFAEDGLRAVEMWEKGGYDLILMDVQMPRLDGFEAARTIREKERERGGHTPIVAITAHAFKEDEEKCLAAGMDAYIAKPIDFKVCLHLIQETLKPTTSPSDRETRKSG